MCYQQKKLWPSNLRLHNVDPARQHERKRCSDVEALYRVVLLPGHGKNAAEADKSN